MFRSPALRDLLASSLDPDPRPSLPPGTSLAAVLIPVLVASPEPRVVFTRRSEGLPRHPGEISFPGGLADGEESPAGAALREAQEELGLIPDDIELLGALPAVHTRVSGFLIVPFVGLLSADPRFTPNAAEIDAVLEFPLDGLVAAGTEREFRYAGMSLPTFVYDMDGHVIWGATARILWSFIEALRAGDSNGRAGRRMAEGE